MILVLIQRRANAGPGAECGEVKLPAMARLLNFSCFAYFVPTTGMTAGTT